MNWNYCCLHPKIVYQLLHSRKLLEVRYPRHGRLEQELRDRVMRVVGGAHSECSSVAPRPAAHRTQCHPHAAALQRSHHERF